MDRGKAGSKLHAIADRAGIPLTIAVSAANTNDHLLLLTLVDSIRAVKGPTGRPRFRPLKLHGDKGYDHRSCRDGLRARGIIPRIARRGIESKARLGRHRWVIEAVFSWLGRYRRLIRRYDRKAKHFQAFARLACAMVCYRKLIKPHPKPRTIPN